MKNTILFIGDAFRIGYVLPSKKVADQISIHYSGGGIALQAQTLMGLYPNGDWKLRHHDPYDPKTAPLRIAYHLKRFTDKRYPESLKKEVMRMAGAERAWKTQTILFEAQEIKINWKQWMPGATSAHIVVERTNEAGNGNVDPNKYQIQPCAFYVRVPSPVLDPEDKGGIENAFPNIETKNAIFAVLPAAQIAAITKVRLQSSYESIIVDVQKWLDANPGSDSVRKQLFGANPAPLCYLVLRLPGWAIAVWEVPAKKMCENAWVCFDPEIPADLKNIGAGVVRGYAGVVVASLVNALNECNATATKSEINTAIEGFAKDCVVNMKRFWENGAERLLSIPKDDEKRKEAGMEEPRAKGKGWGFDEVEKALNKNPIEPKWLPLDLGKIRSRETLWSLADDVVKGKNSYSDGAIFKVREVEERGKSDFFTAGLAFLSTEKEEDERLWNSLPFVKVKALELIDRLEIQDYLALQGILLNYVDSHPKRPINIGVFGPPGSGKSFGTKQLLQFVGNGSNIFQPVPCEFNLSQFRNVRDLAEALHQVRNEGLKQTIPIAFFDEFDSSFEGRPYGWLQYLLAPMQDGTFWDNNQTYTLGRCVLVFAGGINRRFEEMNGRLRDPVFCAAKGPDFISRLRGVLNIRGVNRPDDDEDGRYLLRRAVLLRGMLKEKHKSANVPAPKRLMDAPLAWAFMNIEGFKHGNRSMEAILSMSHFRPGKPLLASDLPPAEQLEMHVDSKHFLDFVNEMIRNR